MSERKGIDISAWQREINWARVKQAGMEFAMIRVGVGAYQDTMFSKNIQSAMEQGIDCGVYHYSLADTTVEARSEANLALAAIRPYSLMLPVAFDIEDKVQSPLTKTLRTDLAQTYCDAVGNAGYRPMVYTSLSWFQTMLERPRLTAYESWVAQWDVPRCGFDGALSMWQHSSRGRVDGISGDVDLNISYQDYRRPDPIDLTPPLLATDIVRAGKRLILARVPLYAASTARLPSGILNGTYWVYDGIVKNGRLRVTNSFQNIGKKPIGVYVTGYISLQDAK